MGKVRIDWRDLELAFDSPPPGVIGSLSLFDTRDGAIHHIEDDDSEESNALLDAETTVEVPTIDSSEAWEFMQQFTETLPAGRAREALEQAIQGRGAFRRFKDGVYDHGLVEEWTDFEARCTFRSIVAWLKDIGVEPENPPPLSLDEPKKTIPPALAEQAERLARLAAELDDAAAHARVARDHLLAGEVPRGAAHALAVDGHLREATALFAAVSRAHARASSPGGGQA